MKNIPVFFLTAPILLFIGNSGFTATGESLQTLSPIYKIERIYKSMQGPRSNKSISLLKDKTPELLWITGYRATMVGSDGILPESQEFMCHSSLDFDIQRHRKLFNWTKNASRRLFTLSQGQFEINFPEGFGIPIFSDEILSLTTQVLNLNPQSQTHHVRHKVTIEYRWDRDLTKPMKALYMRSAQGLVLLEGPDGYYNVENPSTDIHGQGCLIGENAMGSPRPDSYGRIFTGHWIVKPGREVNHTLVTNWTNLPFDTTVHYIAVHLHPYAESLELRDLTTDKTVFKSRVKAPADKIGIERVEYYSSVEGLPLFKDHEYEIISVYNNTSSEDQDSMAVMYLYMLDKEFQKSGLRPELEKLTQHGAAPLTNSL